MPSELFLTQLRRTKGLVRREEAGFRGLPARLMLWLQRLRYAQHRQQADRRGYPPSKRALDLVFAVPLAILAAPVVMIAALLMRVNSPGPAFFQQVRIGLHEQPFTLLKLRTMYVDCDDAAQRDANIRELEGNSVPDAPDGLFKIHDDPRVTPVGRLLRRFSIDELPQLINVLRGEMSLVGPRPSLPWEVALYPLEQRGRHACPPGITGLWQVSGRNRLPIPQMLALDMQYVATRTLLGDIKILMRTPWVVLVERETR